MFTNKLVKYFATILQPFPPFKVSQLRELGEIDKKPDVLIVDSNDEARVQLFHAIRNTNLFNIMSVASTEESYDHIKDADILVYHWHRDSDWTDANQVIGSWRRSHEGPICILTPFLEAKVRRSFYISGVSNVIETETTTLIPDSQGGEVLFDVETVLAVLHNYQRTEAFRRMIKEYAKREEYLLEYLERATQEITRLKRYVPISVAVVVLLLFLQLSGNEIPWDMLAKLVGM